ncbi:MAG: helix-turn-helix domain-containing protein [Ktedonobacteraceae bacterium]|nr:helix-turn-helix domain-containing protein [Ktedonobacteraceae bacterium]MBA3823752.1 helix-turn-helix domain-containing protein [Ktedonobacterales bacterium]
MPRMQAPDGYLTSSEAAEILNCSVAMVYNYEKSGQLHKTVPPGRKQGFFSENEVKALSEGLASFFDASLHPTDSKDDGLTFRQATSDDMEGVYKVAASLFGTTTSAEARKPLIEACPEGNYVVERNGQIVAYLHAQPLRHERMMAFMNGEIRGKDISVSDLDCFRPGQKSECLIKSIGATKQIGATDKDRRANQQRFIMRLLQGVKAELEEMGSRGIIIDKIFGTSETPTGIAMGFSASMQQFGKPLGEGRFRFVMNVEESELSIFDPYKEALIKWQKLHGNASIRQKHTT